MVGAMSPSSKYLANVMLKSIDFSKCKTLVELGPGNGVFTEKILERMLPDAKLLAFELNEGFYRDLQHKIKDDRLILVNDSAELIGTYLKKHGLDKADVVISSLPLANFPSSLRSSVLNESYENLTPVGKYIQFQYSLQSKKYIKKIFKQVDIKFTLANFPPAFVYSCVK